MTRPLLLALPAAACLALTFISCTSDEEGDEPAAAADSPVIDCHLHFWHLDRPDGISWIDPENTTLFRSFLPEDFAPIAEANGVDGVVVVQAGQHLPDNRWNLELTADQPELYRGIVGNLSEVIGSDDFRPLFEELCEDPRYLGYRLSGRYEEGLSDALFRDLQLTADRGKTVDFLVGGYSLEDVSIIAARVPELKIILDHFGNLTLDGSPLDPAWVESFRAAAAHPEVHCKVSALYGRVKPQPAPQEPDFYKPILDLALECFGEDRLIFGSDWPVTRTTGDYASVLALTRSYFEALDPRIAEKLFSQNAVRFYGLADLE